MSLLVAHNLSQVFGAEEIFSGVSVEIPQRARIALVGPNGAGKTTLLRLLVGLDIPTTGTISIAKGTRLGFLPQRPELMGEHTLWEEQLGAFADLRHMEARMAELSSRLDDPSAMAEYGELQHEFELRGGYTYETRIKMALDGVGFRPQDYHKPLPQLSGGQKTRALLARLLLQAPDLLILDEPTNHLDIAAVEWLEDFLQSFPGAVLAVSHDRYFMDTFASTVWELEFGQLETYRGNYSHYLRQREERRERLQREYEAQQAFIAKEMDFIRRYMDSQKTAQAKGRLRRLETMAKRGKIIARGPQERKQMKLKLVAANQSGDKVLMARNLSVGYPDDQRVLFCVPELTLYRGETAAIIGPNGAGKSTLLKTLIGQLAPLDGTCQLGASVQVGYFAQAHETLNPRHTLIDAITESKPMPISEARNILGAFMFSGDDAFRTVDTLSGGERGRLALARLTLLGANLLLLDEPTNHLDIDSQEILQEVLEDFSGTILLVSHDRYLIRALATQIWAVSEGSLEIFDGTYDEYLAVRRQRLSANAAPVQASARPSGKAPAADPKPARKHGLNPYQLKKRIAELEAEIERLEAEMSAIYAELDAASARGDARAAQSLGQRYAKTEMALNAAIETWGELAE
ncbi:MAG: ABC-F family ATP-binding cassette domain-containing protein [Anaerolineae bacterium]|nr:ABC-F family ATP-binding cassette domain-containing protein [Anaerolineae bacterium]MDW8173891.1 ABC-F family ATP-binding cassette domain-containing protein [Anaerolineae bacterium]